MVSNFFKYKVIQEGLGKGPVYVYFLKEKEKTLFQKGSRYLGILESIDLLDSSFILRISRVALEKTIIIEARSKDVNVEDRGLFNISIRLSEIKGETDEKDRRS